MENWCKGHHPEAVRLGNGHVIGERGPGEVHLISNVFGETHPVRLKKTLYFPGIQRILMSVQEIAKKGKKIVHQESQCTLIDSNKKKLFVSGE